MALTIQLRRGTAAQWNSANPVLAIGEIAVETDTRQYKVGDGVNVWTNLAYGGPTGPQGPQGMQGPSGLATVNTSNPLIYDPITNTLSIDPSDFPDGGNF